MLNNVEKEKLVIDLYYNQRKNVIKTRNKKYNTNCNFIIKLLQD